MSSEKSETDDQILQKQHVTLLDLLDRLLDKGVVAKGEVILTVADVDLVYLNLGLLLAAVKTVESAARRGGSGDGEALPKQLSEQGKLLEELQQEAGRTDAESPAVAREIPPEKSGRSEEGRRRGGLGETIAGVLPSLATPSPGPRSRRVAGSRANVDQRNVEKGLVKLVLTLVELIRQLMERQAIRRVEEGQLSAREIEDVGNAFSILDEKMEELKKTFGLSDEDLNLDLGPLGELL